MAEVICERCGASISGLVSDTYGIEEESGEVWCAHCLAEQESCGCADSVSEED